jgi:membrane associated rhomboid family serine protease
MFVLPLGLGTRPRRFPLMTALIAAVWVLVMLFDRSDQIISKLMLDAAQKSGIRDQSRNLFIEYCKKQGGIETNCRKYSVLLWTGFPSDPNNKKKNIAKQELSAKKWREYKNLLTELDAAETVKQDLADCSTSKICYKYKGIVKRFFASSKAEPQRFLNMQSYAGYAQANSRFHSYLKRICMQHNCLSRSYISPFSVGMAQIRHGGWVHLLGNLAALVLFGIYVEQRTGRLMFLILSVAGGSFGLAVHALFFGNSQSIVLGGSANVSCVMGMFLVFFFHSKMRFLVWLPRKFYAGSSFFAEVKYCFPLLFIIGDLVGGFGQGIGSVTGSNVAHFAHLAGLGFGIVAALIFQRFSKLSQPLLFKGEDEDIRSLEACKDMDGILVKATDMVQINPENVHAMEYACGSFIRWSQVGDYIKQKNTLDSGRAFLMDHLSTVCAINTRRGEMRYACKILSQIPLYMPYRFYLHRLGQVSSLKLADFALSQGHPLLAIRLYDFFLSRYPLSLKAESLVETLTDLLFSLPPTEDNTKSLRIFIEYHPDSQIADRIAAWLSNHGVEAV